jgi:hypothetical protein
MIKCTLWFARNIPDERGQAPKPVAAAQPECLARSATFRKMAKRLGCPDGFEIEDNKDGGWRH